MVNSVPDALASPRPTCSKASAGSAASPGCRRCACRPRCRGRRPVSRSSIRARNGRSGALPARTAFPLSLRTPCRPRCCCRWDASDRRSSPIRISRLTSDGNSAIVYSTTAALFRRRGLQAHRRSDRATAKPEVPTTRASGGAAAAPDRAVDPDRRGRRPTRIGHPGGGKNRRRSRSGLPADAYPAPDLTERLRAGR